MELVIRVAFVAITVLPAMACNKPDRSQPPPAISQPAPGSGSDLQAEIEKSEREEREVTKKVETLTADIAKAKQAVEISTQDVNKLSGELAIVMTRLDAATDNVIKATTDATRKAAKTTLQTLQAQRVTLEQRMVAAHAAGITAADTLDKLVTQQH